MEWSRGPALPGIWEERMARYARSDLTVAAFCERERVSVPSFYYWRRRLQELSGPAENGLNGVPRATRKPQRQDFIPVTIKNSAAIKMRLPNGVQFWLPAGDAVVLKAAIAAAGSITDALPGDESC